MNNEQFQEMLDGCQPRAGAHWRSWPFVDSAPDVLRAPGSAGHTLILPLAYVDQIGWV